MVEPAAVVATSLAPDLALLNAMVHSEHLGQAADSIGVSRPTAVRMIRALSQTVGLPLTIRVGRHVKLTPAGLELAEAAREVQSILAIGVGRAVQEGRRGRGHVAFGFIRSLGSSRAPQLLRAFRTDYPGIEFSLFQADHDSLVDRLHAGTLDIALSVLRVNDADVRSLALFRDDFVLVVEEFHRLSGRETVRLEECRDETWVGLSGGTAIRERVDRMLSAAGVSARYVVESDEVETVRGLAAHGAGVAVLPQRYGDPVTGSIELPITPRHSRRIGLITSTRHPVPAAAEQFHRWAGTTYPLASPAEPADES